MENHQWAFVFFRLKMLIQTKVCLLMHGAAEKKKKIIRRRKIKRESLNHFF